METGLSQQSVVSITSTISQETCDPEIVDFAFKLIERTFRDLVERRDFKNIFALEIDLWRNFLKNVESEEFYAKFYRAMNTAFGDLKIESPQIDFGIQTEQELKKIDYIFVLHSPFMLAHSTILYNSIANSPLDIRKKVLIFLLNDPTPEFVNKWSELGITVTNPSQEFITCMEVLQNFQIINPRLKTTWMCLPVGLRLASAMLDKVNWWSVKFHPPIDNVNKCIGDIGIGEDFDFLGKPWKYFKAPLKLENEDMPRVSFTTRRNSFGTFTRDTLIDQKDHWKNIEIILQSSPGLEYHYAAKTTVHLKFDFLIPFHNRIVYAGWIEKPADYIANMCFLIDPYPYGHGTLLREAIAAGVPVIYNSKAISKSSNSPIQKIISAESLNFDEFINGKNILIEGRSIPIESCFNNENSLISKVKYLTDENYNQQVAAAYKKILPSKSSQTNTILTFLETLY